MLLLFAMTMYSPLAAAVTIFLWGVATFAIVPPLQMRVMEAASDAPNLASAVNIGAFNLGNAIGAAVGGGVIGLGLGLPAVSIAGAVMEIGRASGRERGCQDVWIWGVAVSIEKK